LTRFFGIILDEKDDGTQKNLIVVAAAMMLLLIDAAIKTALFSVPSFPLLLEN